MPDNKQPNAQVPFKQSLKKRANTIKQFELEYLNMPKFKERATKLGFNSEDLKENIKNKLTNLSVNIYKDPKKKTNRAYYQNSLLGGATINFSEDHKKYTDTEINDTVSHEIGHGFSNYTSANLFSSETGQDKLNQKYNRLLTKDDTTFNTNLKRLNDNWSSKEGHEKISGELVADVHSARYAGYIASNKKIDLRKRNMTDKDYYTLYNDAKNGKNEAFSRIINKIGTPITTKKDRADELILKQKRTPEEEEEMQGLINNYLYKTDKTTGYPIIDRKTNNFIPSEEVEKDEKRKIDSQKKAIIEVMNRTVYNNSNNNSTIYAAYGGKLNSNTMNYVNRVNKFACGGKLARPSSRKRNIIPALTLGMSVASSIFGAVAKAKEAKKQKREQERQAFANLNNQFLEQSRGDNLAYMQSDEDGNSDVQYYANGGKLNNLAPQTLGGELVPIGDGVEEVVGNKHNQTTIDGVSGVQLLENGQPTAEVENGEVIVDGDRVLSNRLMFDANNSYADKMKQLTKKRNKLEAMQEKAKGYRAKNTIERKLASLNAAESTLFQHQEETKYAEGMNELQNVEGTPSFRWGGKTPIPTPFKNNAKDLIFPKTDYGAILNRRLPQLATTELTDPVVSPNAEVKEKSMDEVVLTKKKPAAPPVNATNPLGYAMNPVTADFKVPDTNVHYTPPPSKLDSFLASDAGQFVSTVAPMLIDNVGNAIASKNTPKLPTPLLQYARPLETRVNINPQLAEVRRSNKSIKDTILSNTSNSNTARNAVVSANLSADKQVMDLYGGKENQELQLRNANVQQQQMVDNQNAATLNQHSMNVYQRANDIASKSSANLANLAGDITNASQMVKTDKNFKAYTNANLLDDAEGSKLATYLNNDEYLKDPRNRAFVKSLLSNPYTANKYKHLMPRAQQLGLVN